MKKWLLYLALCLCYSHLSVAQSENWENATVMLQNGASRTGKVLYRNEADVYFGFTFRDSIKVTTQFKAEEVQSLVLSDYKIEYDQVSVKTKKDTFIILVPVVTKGTASLYKCQIQPQKLGLNTAEAPFFIIKSPKGTFPLLYNPYPNQVEYNKFRGVLNYATGGCNDQQQINRLKYNLNAILEVVEYYNKCNNPDLVVSKIRRKSQIPAITSHYVTVGGVLTSRTVGGEWYQGTYYKQPYNMGFGFNLGYSLQAIYPSISKRISTEFGVGIIYAKYQAIPVNRLLLSDDYFAGRLKIIGGYALSKRASMTPVIQLGPSFEFTTDIFSITPLANVGFGLNMKKFFVGGLVEFPFSSFTNRSFYSLNFKYAFAQSENKKQK